MRAEFDGLGCIFALLILVVLALVGGLVIRAFMFGVCIFGGC